MELHAARAGAELHYVALAAQAQPVRYHAHAAHSEKPAALFAERFVVGALMLQAPFGGVQVLAPLLFHVGERPLPPAKAEVLYAGHLQIVVTPRHRFRPQGRATRRR